MDHIQGSWLNLYVVVAGVIGISVLGTRFKSSLKEGDAYLLRAYFIWTFCWIVWFVTWVANSWVAKSTDYVSKKSLISWISIDLDSMLRIILYLTLVRASEFTTRHAIKLGIIMITFIATGYVLIYNIFTFDLAYKLHESFALCLGVVSPVLVGWAFRLRFGSYLPMIAGFIYGFAQPAAFAAAFHGHDNPKDAAALGGVLVFFAIMKVFWATIITGFFFTRPGTERSLVEIPNLANETTLIKQIPPYFLLLPIFLSVAILSGYLYLRPDSLGMLGSIAGIISIYIVIVQFFIKSYQNNPSDSSKKSRPKLKVESNKIARSPRVPDAKNEPPESI